MVAGKERVVAGKSNQLFTLLILVLMVFSLAMREEPTFGCSC